MSHLVRFIAILVLGASTACSAGRVHPLTSVRHPAKSGPEEVRLYLAAPDAAVEEIAWIDSFVANDKQPETRQRQLANIRDRAARIGADGIVEIQSLREKHRGLMPDPTTPVYTWQQGEYELHFLRGKAVRFLDAAPGEDLSGEAVAAQVAEPVEKEPAPPSANRASREAYIPVDSDQPTLTGGGTRPGY